MSGKGNCINAAVLRRENSLPDCFLIPLTCFKTIKAELIWRRTWETRRQAETAIFQYINGFYNPRRRHSALGREKPLGFRTKGGPNEHLERNGNVTGPDQPNLPAIAVSDAASLC